MGSFLEVFDPSSAPTTEYGALRPGLFLEGNWKPVSDLYMHGGHYLMRLNDNRSGILMRQRTLGSLCVHRTSFPTSSLGGTLTDAHAAPEQGVGFGGRVL